jgi:hypothetical protein
VSVVAAALRRAPSAIAGTGWFTDRALPAGALALAVAPGGEPPVNHSCDPNLGWGEGGLVTMRDVEPGAELTTDYALAIADDGYLLRCHCETYRCRQLIGGDDWRIEQLQRRYAGFFAPAVADLIRSG